MKVVENYKINQKSKLWACFPIAVSSCPAAAICIAKLFDPITFL